MLSLDVLRAEFPVVLARFGATVEGVHSGCPNPASSWWKLVAEFSHCAGIGTISAWQQGGCCDIDFSAVDSARGSFFRGEFDHDSVLLEFVASTLASLLGPPDAIIASTEPRPAFVPMHGEHQLTFSFMPIDKDEPLSQMNELTLETGDPAVAAAESAHPDPITDAPGAHPAAVGVGALGAGAAGAAIGALAGPVGIIIGAAIGAIAGGLAGHEVAVANDTANDAPAGDLDPEATGSTTDDEGRPSSVAASPVPVGGSPVILPGYDVGLPVATMQPEAVADDGSDTVTDLSFSPAAAAASRAGEIREFASGNALVSPTVGSEPASPAAGSPVASALDHEFASGTVVSEPAGAHAFGEPGGAGFTVGADPAETVRASAYYHFLDRLESGRPGDELGDWLDAEREVARV